MSMSGIPFNRRLFLQTSASGLAGLGATGLRQRAAAYDKPGDKERPAGKKSKTSFQIACMTLPYSRFSLERALQGIKSAGYRHVAWGTSHSEDGKNVPVVAADAAPDRARELAKKCRDMGLEPVMMFSGVYPEAKNGLEILTSRIKQASAAGISQVLTFGHTRGGDRKLWVERFKKLGPLARDGGVLIVVKQHGGETGTGAVCSDIVRQVDHPNIKVNYDAGNVMDYLRLQPVKVLADLQACAPEVRSFCIKDHRDFPPPHRDCGPGLGEIDHYRLLHPVAFTGLTMPLCCENISAPLLPAPKVPEAVDALARRAREFLEIVIQGLQS
jgi:sugar phosphate isomerase/epimerase